MAEGNSSERRQGRPYFLSETEKAEIIELYEAGAGVCRLAKEFGVVASSVSYLLKSRGITVRKRSHYKMTPEQLNEICKLYELGHRISDLVLRFGITSGTIGEMLRARGIPIRPRSKPKAARRCRNCGTTPIPKNSRFCELCRRRHRNAEIKAWRKMTMEKGICPQCCKPSDREMAICSDCLAKIKVRQRSVKIKCFEGYGGVRCLCCGVTELAFLTIDHVHNNGAEERRNHRYGSSFTGTHFYEHLIKHNFPEGYQVLCFNCNWGKRIHGVCPHQKSTN